MGVVEGDIQIPAGLDEQHGQVVRGDRRIWFGLQEALVNGLCLVGLVLQLQDDPEHRRRPVSSRLLPGHRLELGFRLVQPVLVEVETREQSVCVE